MEFKHATLDNGLDIIAEVNPAAASLALGFFVKTGSRDETSEVLGVSHFLEHMVFKGTDRRSAFDVSREFDEIGAKYNAGTSFEHTVYFGAALPEFQETLTDILCDVMRPALRVEDFKMEKKVILEEIALYEDRPEFCVFDRLMCIYFEGHPLGNRVLGTKESITALSRDQMQVYFDRRYSPGNVTLVGVGRVDFKSLVDKATKMCEHWRPFDAPRATPPAPGITAEKIVVDKKLTRQHLGMLSPAPTSMDESRYAAELAACIMGDHTGSRLYYALIEPAIADEASFSFMAMDGVGCFATFISTNADKASQAAKIAQSEFETFMKEGPTETELQAAKNKIASRTTVKGELPMGRLTAVGGDWLYRGEYLPMSEHIEKLFSVSKKQVVDLVRSYDLSATTLLSLGPADSL